jgi:hypothetical protein
MKQGSRARQKERHRRFASGMVGAVSSMSSGDLSGALAMAADSSDESAPDPPQPVLVPEDPVDPPQKTAPDPNRASRPHIEDDFFARGDEIASFPPSSLDAKLIEAEEVVHRPIDPSVLARRARMRRLVAGVVGTAAALTLIAMGRAWLGRSTNSHAADNSFSVQNRVVPSIAIATAQESVAAAAPPAEEQPPVVQAPPPPAARNLPVVNIELPAPPDEATDQVWSKAVESLSAQDFNGADKALAELGRSSDVATRETARLARAVWWMSHGKQAEVRPVLADLAAHASTPHVQDRAHDLLRAN